MLQLIKNAVVFDGKSEQLADNRWIVIEDNLVREIGTGKTGTERFDHVIDAGGRCVMPGLVDAHVHLGHFFQADYNPEEESDYAVAVSTRVAEMLLMAGFTTIRDAGGIVMGLKKAIDQGFVKGPRIYPSNAAIAQTCGHGDSQGHSHRDLQYRIPLFAVLADGPDEVRRAAREQLYKGSSQIKLMAGGGCSSVHDPLETVQFSLEEMKAAVDCAADFGTYVMAHLYNTKSILRALRAGVKSFEHCHLMDEEGARALSESDVFITPGPQFNAPHSVKANWNPKDYYVQKMEKNATELINRYHLRILFGTDLMMRTRYLTKPGYTIPGSEDLSVYGERFGSFPALLSATGNCNELFRLTGCLNPYPDGQLGVLEAGSYADLLIVDGDPVRKISVLSDPQNLRLIMKNGMIYKDTLS